MLNSNIRVIKARYKIIIGISEAPGDRVSDFMRKLLYAIREREGHFDTRRQRGRVNDPNLPGYLGFPERPRKTAKKLFYGKEETSKR